MAKNRRLKVASGPRKSYLAPALISGLTSLVYSGAVIGTVFGLQKEIFKNYTVKFYVSDPYNIDPAISGNPQLIKEQTGLGSQTLNDFDDNQRTELMKKVKDRSDIYFLLGWFSSPKLEIDDESTSLPLKSFQDAAEKNQGGDIKVYARWTPKKVELEFIDQFGKLEKLPPKNANNKSMIDYGEFLPNLGLSSDNFRRFDGWYTTPTIGGQKVERALSNNVKLYSRWSVLSYDVSFVAFNPVTNLEIPFSSPSVRISADNNRLSKETIQSIKEPFKGKAEEFGYQWLGWFLKLDSQNYREINPDGEVFNEGKAYIFEGRWDIAQPKTMEVTISLGEAQSASFDTNNSPAFNITRLTGLKGSQVNLPNNLVGRTVGWQRQFSHWLDKSTNEVISNTGKYTINSTTNLEAQWKSEEKLHRISYSLPSTSTAQNFVDYNEISDLETKSVTRDTQIVLPTINSSIYAHTGWKVIGEVSSPITPGTQVTVIKDTHYEAVFASTPKTYTIKVIQPTMGTGGATEDVPQEDVSYTVIHGSYLVLPRMVYYKSSTVGQTTSEYKQIGWIIDATGVRIQNGIRVFENITIRPEYGNGVQNIRKFEVTFIAGPLPTERVSSLYSINEGINPPGLDESSPTPGSTFLGWFSVDGLRQWTPATRASRNETYVRKFSGTSSANISFELNGGLFNSSSINPAISNVVIGNPYLLPLEQQLMHSDNTLIFDGWYTDRTAGYKIEPYHTVGAAAQTLYARWVPKKYKTIFNIPTGSSSLSSQSVEGTFNETITLPPAPTNANPQVEFDGWINQKTGTKLPTTFRDEAVGIFEPSWKVKRYTITFERGTFNGVGVNITVNLPNSITKASGEIIDAMPLDPIAVTNQRLRFAGWKNANGQTLQIGYPVTANDTFSATWVEDKFTISYSWGQEIADDRGPNRINEIKVFRSEAISAAGRLLPTTAPTDIANKYKNLDFNGVWINAETGARVIGNEQLSNDIRLIAQWTRKQLTITFDNDDGVANSRKDITVLYGDNVPNSEIDSLETKTRSGYKLLGWFLNGINDVKNQLGRSTIMRSNAIYKAVWLKL